MYLLKDKTIQQTRPILRSIEFVFALIASIFIKEVVFYEFKFQRGGFLFKCGDVFKQVW